MVRKQKKIIFFLRNLLRGLLWLAIIVIFFLAIKKYFNVNFNAWLAAIKPSLVYIIFLLSEVIIGIIPPEIFMIWALRNGDITEYIAIIAAFSFLSYLAGISGYFIGRYLNTTLLYRFLRRKFLSKSEKLLNIYGLYLIIVAAVTPLPFSGVSMLVGSVRYPFNRYVIYSLTRFGRFAVYSWLIWEANML